MGWVRFFVSSAFHLSFVYRQFGVCTVLDSIDKSLNMLNDMQFLEFHFCFLVEIDRNFDQTYKGFPVCKFIKMRTD